MHPDQSVVLAQAGQKMHERVTHKKLKGFSFRTGSRFLYILNLYHGAEQDLISFLRQGLK